VVEVGVVVGKDFGALSKVKADLTAAVEGAVVRVEGGGGGAVGVGSSSESLKTMTSDDPSSSFCLSQSFNPDSTFLLFALLVTIASSPLSIARYALSVL